MLQPKVNILDYSPAHLADYLESIGEKSTQSGLLIKGIFKSQVTSLSEIPGVNSSLSGKLAEYAGLGTLDPLEEQISDDGLTRKILFQLEDGKTIESTLMFFRNSSTGRERRTVCVSSQVGCSIGCRYCATGRQGFERNLRPNEILNQILYFLRWLGDTDGDNGKGWLSNVVFMGMGEPLANYENVSHAIAMLNDQRGLGLGSHQLTLSTSGLVPQIRRLAGEKLQVQLAVSLHAANNDMRDYLVPINKKYPLAELMDACHEYADKTGRKIFIEYALFEGVNDSVLGATDLIALLDNLDCTINLIPGNLTSPENFKPTSVEQAMKFQRQLISGGFRTMLRMARGTDIQAGCGQLRSRRLDGDRVAAEE
ncbi:MAG: 23S rRNA (adenine(2503)-C(2))-methyltransferase RlmN [Dehalogenimonas sp.]|uniref:23S rRNA (Adenine(2503)-C(2))-methyltransferase RlmN n=1 Tax=Candidatus Dehalogenimonas loeffleri TaxID=3127115 RepID=A0ABZ2J604_9CHLR|nr:23S rRNA (adenine(2503)-C(2))-methyltransferase RlmN [Dehalogenimonas sp.]